VSRSRKKIKRLASARTAAQRLASRRASFSEVKTSRGRLRLCRSLAPALICTFVVTAYIVFLIPAFRGGGAAARHAICLLVHPALQEAGACALRFTMGKGGRRKSKARDPFRDQCVRAPPAAPSIGSRADTIRAPAPPPPTPRHSSVLCFSPSKWPWRSSAASS